MSGNIRSFPEGMAHMLSAPEMILANEAATDLMNEEDWIVDRQANGSTRRLDRDAETIKLAGRVNKVRILRFWHVGSWVLLRMPRDCLFPGWLSSRRGGVGIFTLGTIFIVVVCLEGV